MCCTNTRLRMRRMYYIYNYSQYMLVLASFQYDTSTVRLDIFQ